MLLSESRQAVRALARRPALAALVVLTLALCIGANTAVFSIVNAVLLAPPPYVAPDRLVHVWSRDPRQADADRPVRYADFVQWRSAARSLDGIGAYYPGWRATLVDDGQPERLTTAGVSAELFRVLGVTPRLGRGFLAAEEMIAPRAIVLDHAFWRRRFGGDTAVVGRELVLGAEGLPLGGNITRGGDRYTVIGVLPEGFTLPTGPHDAYVPLGALGRTTLAGRGPAILQVIARMRVGASLEDVRRELARLARLVDESDPGAGGWRTHVVTLRERMVGSRRAELLVLFGAVAAVLVIGCVNVAGLLLGRSAAREREFAVRAALGASRSELARHALAESLVLASLAGLASTVVAILGAEWLERAAPPALLDATGAPLDYRVFGFAALMAVATGIACGMVPAMRASGAAPGDVLRRGGDRSSTRGRRAHRTRRALVAAESALGVAIAVGAMLLARSFTEVRRVEAGFRPEQAFAARFTLARWRFGDPSIRAETVGRMLERVRGIPGVLAAGATSRLPLGDPGGSSAWMIDGETDAPPDARPRAGTQAISGDYLRATGIPLLAGRDLAERDVGATRVALVNQSFVDRHLRGREPLGLRLRVGNGATSLSYEVVGVIGNARDRSLREGATPQLYFSYRQQTPADFSIVVRTTRGPEVASELRRTLASVEPTLPAIEIIALGDVLDRAMAGERFMAALVGGFAAMSLLLAAIGMYGTMAEVVSSRRREMGVRLALGASPSEIGRLVARDAARVLLVATAVGIPMALAAASALRSMLYGVGPFDPGSHALAVGVVLVAGLAGSLVPARRASRVDPLVMLRAEG